MALGSIILITVVNPYFLVIVAIIGVVSMVLRHIYLKTSKNIKRLEGISKYLTFLIFQSIKEVSFNFFSEESSFYSLKRHHQWLNHN